MWTYSEKYNGICELIGKIITEVKYMWTPDSFFFFCEVFCSKYAHVNISLPPFPAGYSDLEHFECWFSRPDALGFTSRFVVLEKRANRKFYHRKSMRTCSENVSEV